MSLWLGGFVVFAQRINSYKVDIDSYTDAVIALTGGRHRIAEAVKMLELGKAKRLFISGVGDGTSWSDIKDAQGLTVDDDMEIIIGYKAKNTIENAKETLDWVHKNKLKSIRLVTSHYHVERSLVEFSAKDKKLKIIPHPVYSEKVKKKWWKSWHTFLLIFEEYNKFLYVHIRCNVLRRN